MSEIGAIVQKITVTESAANRVSELIASEGNKALMLRVAVSAGGCSGFEYGFNLDKDHNDDDQIFEAHGIKIVVDETSLELLGGSTVDYVDDLAGASFRLQIPNATASCGCGISFSV
ncbi:MAG: iron-sulfur cluster assembly accessory protein [Rhodospirillaceae bacterium TMED167]|nr:iron-sulfur cluster insertion protein ErpA [Rhodospirillaceae bacterium]OUW26947.1 MAG: iron-sulfur cluster assembly accessory protein [Rhodospirillaceae bacterium TMED167]